ncbi:uncharacterized protein BDV14DRAFT_199574 [Aspergillus stella-maris]|uniref:uncharacterized protein n=1 Tax=Aspergillus stella-maris TaxID=1810926 RepID=UPI003CCE4BCC
MFGPLSSSLPLAIGLAALLSPAAGLSVSVPSPRDLLNDPCATFRLPPRIVNSTYLDETTVEHAWIEPPFGFGYGKWALSWTSIPDYWEWYNMQNEWYPLQSTQQNSTSPLSTLHPTKIADINSFNLPPSNTTVTTPGTDTPLHGIPYAWNYTVPASIMFETDYTCWAGWGYDFYAQGAPYFVSYDASTVGVKDMSFGVSIYSARETGPTDRTVAEIAGCFDGLGSGTFADLFRSMKRTPVDGKRSGRLSWRAGSNGYERDEEAEKERERLIGRGSEQFLL